MKRLTMLCSLMALGISTGTVHAKPERFYLEDSRTVELPKPQGVAPGAAPTASTCSSIRINWGYKYGWTKLILNSSSITKNSRVFVSASEVDAYGNRFIGDAEYQVNNIAPRDGAVEVLLYINWGSKLLTYTDYLVCN